MDSNEVRFLFIFYCYVTVVDVLCMDDYKCFNGKLQERRYASSSFDDKSKFNQSLDDLPLHLTVTECEATRDDATIPCLNASVSQVREQVLLILLAIPFNTSECPARLTGSEDLRQYQDAFDVPANASDFVVDFNCVFTGCYYFMMDNEKGKRWQSGLRYYQRNYKFGDRKITTIGNPTYHELSRTLEVVVKLPLYCVKGDVALCDVKEYDNVTKAMEIHKCSIVVENATGPLIIHPGSSDLLSHVRLEAHISERVKDSEETIVSMEWKNLEQGHKYFVRIQSDWHDCSDEHPGLDIRLWDIPGVYTYAYPESRIDNSDIPVASNVLEIGCITLGTSATCAVLVYWIFKYMKLCQSPKNSGFRDWTRSTVPQSNKGLEQIVLIYEKGSPQFMQAMEQFRLKLRQKCNCEVREVFSREDFDKIASSIPAGWLREHTHSGSKFVWVDTPAFRSRFRNGNQWNGSSDFRSTAVPYAVALTKQLSPNASSQYVNHFVVRIKGLEVDNERENDPLLMISPHTRYFIPEHFDRLCEHLSNPTDCSAETSIDLPSSNH